MTHHTCGILFGTIAIVLAGAPVSRVAEAAPTAHSDRLAMVVRTYTQPEWELDLGSARRTAAVILDRAGIHVSWRECGLPTDSTHASDECARPLAGNEVVVRVQRSVADDGRPHADTLGFAYVDPGTGRGSLATVYADRVRAMAQRAGVDRRELLGRAIAHELGHLLLGTLRHAADGLMRATWSSADLRRNLALHWLFGSREGEAMRSELASRSPTRHTGAPQAIVAVGLQPR
jgi:hypothetical protein